MAQEAKRNTQQAAKPATEPCRNFFMSRLPSKNTYESRRPCAAKAAMRPTTPRLP
eukprot:CAMPEP_0197651456 /NCGR_PEP_ID=MMETSP1338-20131121/32597_1 /TAXON_ID=43686 ORGANISM="Pelagodinium beii, Strain RCC1491" /NCGR_SAMPLE_ID=MMETSP1338 /ASSEMBLY_ACC=CAM_ASM_000754 /LENGTH=54 /DNA_ID=CAMNT_0043226087 /DNA_START=22 /DNA_END=182 /DNA_ORIENTATION=+